MKRLAPALPCLLLLAGLASADPGTDSRLAQIKRLHAEAARLMRQGKFGEAAVVLEKRLALEKAAHGPDSDAVLDTLEALADAHPAHGDFAGGLKALREVVAIRTRRGGPKHHLTVTARLNLADLGAVAGLKPDQMRRFSQALAQAGQVVRLYRAEKYAAALPLAEKSLRTMAEVMGEKNRYYGQGLFNLAAQHLALRHFEDAELQLNKARSLYRDLAGEDHPDYAQTLQKLAQLHEARHDFLRAEPLLLRTAAIHKAAAGPASADYATSMHLLAGLYRGMGDYDRAEKHERLGLEIRRKALGPTHPLTLTSLNALGLVLEARGNPAAAAKVYRECLALRRKALPPNHPAVATSLNNLAHVSTRLGDHVRAEQLFREALAIKEKAKLPRDRRFAITLNNLGVALEAQGNSAAAERYLKEALAIFEKDKTDPNYVNNLNALGWLFHQQGEYARAEPYYRLAHQTARAAYGEHHPEYAVSANNLGVLELNLLRYDTARRLLEEARDLRRKTLGPTHPLYAKTLASLAVLALRQRKAGEALRHSAEALAVFERHAQDAFAVQSDYQRRELLASLRDNLDLYLSSARGKASAAGLYAHVLAWKGAALARAAEERLARDSPALRPQFAELAEARDRLARLALATPLPDERAAWLRQLAELRKRKEELEGALADRSDAFRRQRQRKPPTARDVATALPPRAAVLDFLVYRDYTALKPVKGRQRPQRVLAAFVLRNGKEPALVPLGNAETVTREAAAWRTALVGGDAAALRTTGAALAARVWAPLRAHLDGASTILAAPDGPLCGLPLAALPGGKDGTYLGEERAFAQVTSGLHVLELYAAAAAKNRGLLAVGGIDYGAAKPGAAAAFPPLPGARLEAEAVRGLFARSFAGEPVALLDGARATRHGLCDAAQRDRYRVIHVAGHGFYTSAAGQAQAGSRGPGPQPLAPFPEGALRHEPLLLSGLALAGANAGPDGILTAAEVSGLDLRGTELVVLSACETGLGDLDRAGEGLLGLQRAFQQAGARTLVTSLWKVDDAATALLMEKFYEGFCAQKRGKLEALRQAQLFVLRNPDAVERRRQGLSAEARKRGLNLGASRPLPGGGKAAGRSHPALWAAFVLSGDGR